MEHDLQMLIFPTGTGRSFPRDDARAGYVRIMDSPRTLVVDDESSIRRILQAVLTRSGHTVTTAENGARALEHLTEGVFDLVVTDLRMPGIGGMELLSWCVQHIPGVPVVILTAFGSVDSAVEAIKLGAFDYITKPFDQQDLRLVLDKALAHRRRTCRNLHAEAGGCHALIGQTPGMRQVYDLITKVAASPTTVLLQGESGTGKELVARALHEHSTRAKGPFIHVNCGAIPANLFESELFGYERGAFTGAVCAKPGRFELADGGTILLDEISELPKDMQVKLLLVLQERTFERVGGLKTLTVDARVIAATNTDLAAAVRAGQFREDLYWRLNVVPIRIPPLRERVEDIPLLVEHFIARFNQRLGRTVTGVSAEAMTALLAAPWPGNVRELENVLERAVLLAESDMLQASDLHGVETSVVAPIPDGQDLKEIVRVHTAAVERVKIREALDETGGNVTQAARKLGISRKGLQLKMREYGLREDANGPDGG